MAIASESGGREGLRAVRWAAHQDCVAKTNAAFFEAVEQSACPDEFSRENAKAEEDHEHARAGSDEHDYAEDNHSEAHHDLCVALGLLDRLHVERHGDPVVQSAWLLRLTIVSDQGTYFHDTRIGGRTVI